MEFTFALEFTFSSQLIIKIKETHESVRVLWYNGRIAGIILRINGFCVHRRNPALFSVGDSMFLEGTWYIGLIAAVLTFIRKK